MNVSEVQRRLIQLGYDLGRAGADGVNGPKTKAAIKQFQRDRGLVADGIVGPRTRAALNAGGSVASNSDIKALFIHCSATPPDMDIGVATIRKWHKDKGWADIGYHWLIDRHGIKHNGRDLDGDGDVEDETGAHAYGHNKGTLAVCLVGGVDNDNKPECNFTKAQFDTLDKLVEYARNKYPGIRIRGHNEVSNKACPSFNVRERYGR